MLARQLRLLRLTWLPRLPRLHPRLRELVRRYAGPEICGTIGAMTAAWVTYRSTHSLPAMALAGNIAEFIAYYGYVGTREAIAQLHRHRHHPPLKRYVLTALKTIRDILMEFAPGEILDSLVLRPLLMVVFPILLHNVAVGVLVGKIVADIVFYGLTALLYEVKKRRLYAEAVSELEDAAEKKAEPKPSLSTSTT